MRIDNESRDDLSLHAWCAVMISASDHAGLRPIRQRQFHQLIYLASALAPIWDEVGPYQLVMKNKQGPYYPDAQWQLDRLATQGMLEIQGGKLELDLDSDDVWWPSTSYSLTQSGVECLSKLVALDKWLIRHRALRDLCLAYVEAGAHQDAIDAVLFDATYAQSGVENESIIRIRNREENRSFQKALQIRNQYPSSLAVDDRDIARVYAAYIRLVADAATMQNI